MSGAARCAGCARGTRPRRTSTRSQMRWGRRSLQVHEHEPEFARPLCEHEVDADPFRQFADWFAQARASGMRAPEAAALATATRDGAPSVRMVLVKSVEQPGFVFYSNYESRKGGELAQNPRAALLFHWDRLGRQVRIEGSVQPTTVEESAAY